MCDDWLANFALTFLEGLHRAMSQSSCGSGLLLPGNAIEVSIS